MLTSLPNHSLEKTNSQQKRQSNKTSQQLRLKIKLSRFISAHMSSTLESDENNSKFNQTMGQNLSQLGSTQPNTFNEYHLLNTPRKQRKLSRPSNYQLYKEEQKLMKVKQTSKIEEWKNKYSIEKDEAQKQEEESKSLLGFKGKKSKYLAYKCYQALNKKNQNNIKDQNNEKKIEKLPFSCDNMAFLRKCKQKLQSTSYSTIPTRSSSHIEPQLLTLVPLTKQKPQNVKTPQKRTRTSFKSSRTASSLNKNERVDDTQLCRPWSGIKKGQILDCNDFLFF